MSQTIDVTGLPPPVVQGIQELVDTLRSSLGPELSNGESPAKWIRRWHEWTASHPRISTPADDSRDRAYEGRGE